MYSLVSHIIKGRTQTFNHLSVPGSVLKGIVRPKEEEVRGGWKILHNEQFHNFYYFHNIEKVNSEAFGRKT